MKPRFRKKAFKGKGRLKSKIEVATNAQLSRSGLDFSYETEALPYTIDHKYLPDFIVALPSGDKLYIECKGLFCSSDRRKMLAVKKRHPQLDIRLLFEKDNKLNKRSKTRYSDWCNRYGFLFSFKTVPQGWLK